MPMADCSSLKERRNAFAPRFAFDFGVREATVADADALTEWLRDRAAAEASGEIEATIERLEARCRELAIEPPTVERAERIARAALRAHEERFHADIYGRLSPAIREHLDDAAEQLQFRQFLLHAGEAGPPWIATQC